MKRVIKITSPVGEEGGGRGLWEGGAQEIKATGGERQRLFLYLGNRNTRMSRPNSWLDAGGANSNGVGLKAWLPVGGGAGWEGLIGGGEGREMDRTDVFFFSAELLENKSSFRWPQNRGVALSLQVFGEHLKAVYH